MIIEVKDNVIITEWWTSKEEEDGKKQITEEKLTLSLGTENFTKRFWRSTAPKL